jgi:hypothetical protein
MFVSIVDFKCEKQTSSGILYYPEIGILRFRSVLSEVIGNVYFINCWFGDDVVFDILDTVIIIGNYWISNSNYQTFSK